MPIAIETWETEIRDGNYSTAAVRQNLNAHRVTAKLQDISSQTVHRLGLYNKRISPACSELGKVLFLAPSVTFCLCIKYLGNC